MAQRWTLLAAMGALVIALAACGAGGGLEALAGPSRPGKLVKLPDGRVMNLRCSGRGSPTVLLESGFGADSAAWFKVQPPLSRTTRVCAYDRAGSGFSDLGPLPRDGANIARDLDAALRAANESGPFIVIGHSAGALYGRLFAARRSSEVVGLILLDPTVERRAPRPAGDGLDGIRNRLRQCLTTAETTPQPDIRDAAWSGCRGEDPDARTETIVRNAATWRSQLSELDNLFGRTSEQVFRLNGVLAKTPLYVITASETAAAAPAYEGESILEMQHRMIAGSHETGYQQTVLSSHLVMIERPDIVLSAAREMVAAAHAGVRPSPLPSSERLTPGASGEIERLLAPLDLEFDRGGR